MEELRQEQVSRSRIPQQIVTTVHSSSLASRFPRGKRELRCFARHSRTLHRVHPKCRSETTTARTCRFSISPLILILTLTDTDHPSIGQFGVNLQVFTCLVCKQATPITWEQRVPLMKIMNHPPLLSRICLRPLRIVRLGTWACLSCFLCP
ncbi:hypothetical protein B0T20DRAFT_47585 [Sordaria brevicollis]|uniref:Uncharacterized protein n=1 Tax=Sordaria brevicollis TaxID=83679 RepID=A0AAE0U9T4_SORBR|nr:hypothetical protein B0T20DRAFT_47585 [Sordaria brevicollis]